jgi:hypothetical protein
MTCDSMPLAFPWFACAKYVLDPDMYPADWPLSGARCDRHRPNFLDRAMFKCQPSVSAQVERCKPTLARAFVDCGAGPMYLVRNGDTRRHYFDDPNMPRGKARFTSDETGVFVLWRGGLPVWEFYLIAGCDITVPLRVVNDPTIPFSFNDGRAIQC